MIKKKLGKIVFAWNPQALNGRGYWYVAGKDDTYARAASKMEATRLGAPKGAEMPPKGVSKENQPNETEKSPKKRSKFYFTTSRSGQPIRRRFKTSPYGRQDDDGPSQYEMADVVRSKGLMQLASERMMSGEGIGKSLKGAISDKIKARATNLKKMADPLNLLNKLPGIGKFAATAYGKKKGRSAADISYFTGIQAPTALQEEEPMEDSSSDNPESSRVAETKQKKEKSTNLAPIMNKMLTQLVNINKKINLLAPKSEKEESKTAKDKTASKVGGKKKTDGNVSRSLDNLYNLFYERFEEEKKEKEIQKSFAEEKEQEEARRHKELIDAVLKGIKPKEEGEKPKEEKGKGLFDSLFDILTTMKSLFSNVVSKIGELFIKYGGQAISAAKNVLPAAKSIASSPAAATVGTVALAGAVVYGGLKSAEMAGEKINKEIKEAAAAGDIKKLKFKVAESYEDEDFDTKLGYNPVTPTLDAMERKEVRAKLEEAANAGSKKAAEALTKLDSTYPKPVSTSAQKNKTATKQKTEKEKTVEQKSATPIKQPSKTSERTEEYIGGEKVIPGQPLSEKQMLAAKLNLESGGKLNPETQKAYDLAKKSGPRAPEMVKPKPQQSTTKQTAVPVADKKTQTIEFIGGEKVIPGQPLSEKQMLAAKLNLESGGKLNPETKKSYDLAKQLEIQPSTLGQRASASTQENRNLTGPVSQATSPVIVNKTTNVVNNGGSAGASIVSSALVRNDESVLTRLQMQGARPV